jgi:YVTN family beta-propeller protein
MLIQRFGGRHLPVVEVHFEEVSFPMKVSRSLMKSLNPAAVLIALLSFVSNIEVSALPLHTATSAPPPAFRVEKQWTLGGVGGWGLLALDASAHRLYIPRSNRVMVVDTGTGALLAEIGGMKNVREMVLDDSGKYGYVTDPTDGTEGFVRVFDRSANRLITSIPTGRVPAAIAFDPATKTVFAFNSHSHSATVIDAATNQVVATIPLSGRPAAAVTDGKGNVFVTLPALGTIVRIDAAQKKVATSMNLAPCTGPAALAIDPTQHQIFTTCENHKLVAVNADSGNVTAIGDAPSGAGDIDFDTVHNMLFLADISGTLTVFGRESSAQYSVVQQIKTQPGARTMIVSPDNNKIYLVTSKFGMNTATASEELQFRPTPVPGTFSVIVVGR